MLWLNKVLPRLNFCYGLVEKASTAVAATIIFALMLLVVADVAGRKFFNSPVHGTIEIASLTLPVIVFLSIAYLQGLKEHVTVDLFTSRLPQQVQLSMDVFAIGLAVAVMAIVTWKTSVFAWSSLVDREFSMGIVEIPIWPARVLVALGSALLSIRLIFDFVGGCATLVSQLHQNN